MASTYTPIATTTLGSAAASYTFSSIPSTYTDLVLIVGNLTNSAANVFYLKINGATSAYSTTYLIGDGTNATSSRSAAPAGIIIGGPIAGLSSTIPSTAIINVQNYANTTTYKTVISRYSNSSTEATTSVGLYSSTSAVTSLTVLGGSGNMQTGSTFTLYGIAAA
jgi:hypothetical protein